MRSRATSIGLAAALLIGLSGCTFTAPQTVQAEYDPSDGFGTVVGDLEVENALLVSATGERANLIASFINNSNQNLEIIVSWETDSGERRERNVYLSSGDSRTVGTPTNPFVLTGLDAPPGSLFPVFFTYEGAEGDELSIPVLEDELEAYADLAPGEATDPGGDETEGSGTAEELESTDELETGDGTDAPGVPEEVAENDESETRD